MVGSVAKAARVARSEDRKPWDGSELPGWKEDLNRVHKQVRARVEHALAHMKSWNILRNCRRKGLGVWYATRGIAQMRNLAMTY
jgi:hypothetical protein